MSNLTHLHGRNTKVKFKSRILEKIHVGSGSEKKIIPDPQHCMKERAIHEKADLLAYALSTLLFSVYLLSGTGTANCFLRG
jgi:hypothetical protein